MNKAKWVLVGAVLLAALAAFAGVRMMHADPGESPEEDGGVKDSTDPTAPKQITSRTITAFFTNFYCADPSDPSRSGSYFFSIEPDAAGMYTLTVSGAVHGSTTVDETVLCRAQEIIDRYALVRFNGIRCVTQGLPAQYQPCSLSVDYASGEHLGFQMDNEPDAQWSMAFRDLFLPLFADEDAPAAADRTDTSG